MIRLALILALLLALAIFIPLARIYFAMNPFCIGGFQ